MDSLRALRIAAGTELATLVVLLVNLATVHWPAVSSAVGPTHGCAYLFVVILTVRQTRTPRTRATAVVPGIGGLLVLRRLTRVPRGGQPVRRAGSPGSAGSGR